MRLHVQQEGHVEGPHQREAQHRPPWRAQQARAGLRPRGGERREGWQAAEEEQK